MERKVVELIQEIIADKKQEKQIVNTVIRDDVFTVLDNECHVLYYSLDDEIEGCHIQKPVNGKMEQFVFINTSKVVQEQIWTAAHELGHVWDVDRDVIEKYPDCKESAEQIVGRFAAEFLMPEDIFRREVLGKLMELRFSGQRMSKEMMVELVTYLMNYFCTPSKSVVRRFVELGYVSDKYEQDYLDGFEENLQLYKRLITENQYTRLEEKKVVYSIGNMQRDLEYLEKRGVLKRKYVQRVRELFHFEDSVTVGGELEFKA